MGNITSTEEITISSVATQLNTINHKLNYCFSNIDKINTRLSQLENSISDYGLQDYNDLYLSKSGCIESNNGNTSSNSEDNSSYIFTNHNDFTWDYYEINKTYLEYVDTNH